MIRETEFVPPESFPLQALQKLTDDQLEALRKQVSHQEEEDEEDEGNPIRCKFCGKKITTREAAFYMKGQHQHAFSNPHGFIFDIGCFSSADGCVNQGVPTLEFTWFPGFSWRFSLCSACHSHLGWFYQSRGEASFYGLILAHLTDA